MGDCKGCGGHEAKEPKLTEIPYSMFRDAVDIEKSHTRRWFIVALVTIIIALASIFANNIIINEKWINYLSQYDFEENSVELSTDGGGDATATLCRCFAKNRGMKREVGEISSASFFG